MRRLTLFFPTKSLTSGMHLTLAVHLHEDQAHFKCLMAPCGYHLLYWTRQF